MVRAFVVDGFVHSGALVNIVVFSTRITPMYLATNNPDILLGDLLEIPEPT